ncbi:MAG: alternative ribosome rescue aminoacyl-tRNA hydrolase ArfB [Acidimicrobiia bacterium]
MQVGSYFIPSGELAWSFGPSGGPGGQHANRSHTRVALRLDLAQTTALPEDTRQHMLSRLGNRAPGGIVTVTVDETRSQSLNRQIALERMHQLLSESIRRPRRRKPTRPSAASRDRRLEDKRRRSERKRERSQNWD